MAGAPPLPLTEAFQSMAEALLIGLLVGAQREGRQGEDLERRAGVRDFAVIALTGGASAIINQPWLTVAALVSVSAVLVAFHLRTKRTGLTTELAGVATFGLGYLTAAPNLPGSAPLAIGTALAMVAILEARRALHAFIRERITEREFNHTLGFLALIFIIYPVLPVGAFGPYQFFNPRSVWLFVILVSSISYVGYFLKKFFGAEKGLEFTGLLGGLASTTAATAAFAQSAAAEPESLAAYWRAAVIANAVQFPRVLAILYVVNAALAGLCLLPLAVMTLAGALFAWILGRRRPPAAGPHPLALGNPFRLSSALKFGALFSVIVLVSKAASTELGTQAVYWTSAVAGSVDADAVVVSMAALVSEQRLDAFSGAAAVLLALAANALLKTGLAAYAGSAAFAWRVAAGFAVMFGAGAAALFLHGLR